MDDPQGTPLSDPQGGHCEGAPHLYLIRGDITKELEVMPVSAQHCCMDHTDEPCFGWVALHVDNLKGYGNGTWCSEADEESRPAAR